MQKRQNIQSYLFSDTDAPEFETRKKKPGSLRSELSSIPRMIGESSFLTKLTPYGSSTPKMSDDWTFDTETEARIAAMKDSKMYGSTICHRNERFNPHQEFPEFLAQLITYSSVSNKLEIFRSDCRYDCKGIESSFVGIQRHQLGHCFEKHRVLHYVPPHIHVIKVKPIYDILLLSDLDIKLKNPIRDNNQTIYGFSKGRAGNEVPGCYKHYFWKKSTDEEENDLWHKIKYEVEAKSMNRFIF